MDYYQILKLKEEGFKEAAIARKLSISRNTVRSYLGKSPEEFETFILTLQAWGRKLDPYRDYICYVVETTSRSNGCSSL